MPNSNLTELLKSEDYSDVLLIIASLGLRSGECITAFAVSSELANRHIEVDTAIVFGEIEMLMSSGLLRSIGGDLRLTELGAEALTRLSKDSQ